MGSILVVIPNHKIGSILVVMGHRHVSTLHTTMQSVCHAHQANMHCSNVVVQMHSAVHVASTSQYMVVTCKCNIQHTVCKNAVGKQAIMYPLRSR